MNDMPIILNRRQAGPAIEGALRHEQVELTRLAVDTHGHTHFAMALAKLVGFDLCPRLAGLSTRKLYLPRGLFATDIGAFTSCYCQSSDELLVGKAWFSTVRSGWWP